jgi:hypothetical protein
LSLCNQSGRVPADEALRITAGDSEIRTKM